MSESNPYIVRNKTEPKTLQNEDELININKSPSIENINKTDPTFPNIKPIISNEKVIVDVESITDQGAKDDGRKVTPADVKVDINFANQEHLVYAYYGQQIRPPKTIWVMYQGATQLPPGATPLEYNPSTRNGFIRLVFTILLIMFIITALLVSIVLFTDLKDTFRKYGLWFAIPAMIMMICLDYAMACSQCVRLYPCNIVCLVLAVIGMSVISSYITSRFRTEIVFYALLATCLVVFVCILLACSGFDFTAWYIYAVVIAAAFGAVAMVAGLVMLITGVYIKMLHLVLLIVGTVLQSIILTIELQMVLGGGAIELGETDYALGAFLLYTSIVDIFLKFVQILGILDN